jgi:hypothetical protein
MIDENIDYEPFDCTLEGVESIGVRLKNGPYSGLEVVFGKIMVDEDGENAILKFNYDVLKEASIVAENATPLNDYLGQFLLTLVQKEIKDGTAIYRNGSDEQN